MRGSIDSRLVGLAVVEGLFLKDKVSKPCGKTPFFLDPSEQIILTHDILKCIANTRIVIDDDNVDDNDDEDEEEEIDENSDHHQKRSDCVVNVGMDALRVLAVTLRLYVRASSFKNMARASIEKSEVTPRKRCRK